MNAYSVIKYHPKFKAIWNIFVSDSKNGTFLFHRDFMEYHKDRFDDFSLMIFRKDKLVGILPANKVGNILHSHQGLTYGGLVLSKSVKFEVVLKSFEAVLKFLYEENIATLYIKEIPAIYNRLPSDEVRYLNFILRAEVFRRDTLLVIDNQNRVKFSNSRLEGIKRGHKHGLKITNDNNFEAFWNEILVINLLEKHGAKPVHSLKDILHLHQKFSDHIKQFNVYKDDKLVAGATIFETETVAHCQYISGNIDKNGLGSLDFLHDYLINTAYADKRYFDFGISNEDKGSTINKGLLFWKEGFGARILAQDFYRIDTTNHRVLNTVLK